MEKVLAKGISTENLQYCVAVWKETVQGEMQLVGVQGTHKLLVQERKQYEELSATKYTGTADPKSGADCILTILGETVEEEKTKAIEDANQRIKELTATIDSNTVKRKQLETGIKNLKAETAANTAG